MQVEEQGRPFGLESLYKEHADYSWVEQLDKDPETEKYGETTLNQTNSAAPNKSSRQVIAGHYVLVRPTPLRFARAWTYVYHLFREPTLVAFSKPLAEELGLTEEDCKDPRFAAFFSGDLSVVPGKKSNLN